jgi:hypothetical protein
VRSVARVATVGGVGLRGRSGGRQPVSSFDYDVVIVGTATAATFSLLGDGA